jgi:hypothetical protein
MGGAILLAAVAAAASPCPAHPATQGQVRSSFVGDVDGDGAPDRVFVSVDADARPRCALHLVVVPRSGRPLLARLRPPALDRYSLRTSGWPRVVELVDIDERPGAEIVFTDHAGASTAFLGVFTVRRGRLVGMRLPPGSGNVFAVSPGPYFGSVDCIGGLVVSTTAELRGAWVLVDRRFYRVTGDAFRLVQARRFRLRPGQDLPTTPASIRPFHLCRFR